MSAGSLARAGSCDACRSSQASAATNRSGCREAQRAPRHPAHGERAPHRGHRQDPAAGHADFTTEPAARSDSAIVAVGHASVASAQSPPSSSDRHDRRRPGGSTRGTSINSGIVVARTLWVLEVAFEGLVSSSVMALTPRSWHPRSLRRSADSDPPAGSRVQLVARQMAAVSSRLFHRPGAPSNLNRRDENAGAENSPDRSD